MLFEGRSVFVEAKAQEGFHTAQMETLKEARERMVASAKWRAKDIRLVALYSSRYSPHLETKANFDALCTRREVASMYPDNAAIYVRADAIYRDRHQHPARLE
jgi:hypothetical protein